MQKPGCRISIHNLVAIIITQGFLPKQALESVNIDY